jgi:uncharacterized protein (TIGR03000 family)
MIRTLPALTVALAACATAAAQPTIRHGNHVRLQPQGVITGPSLGFPGALVAPSPSGPVYPLPRQVRSPYYGPWGYSPFYPVWYDTDPLPPLSSLVPAPVPVYTAPAQTTTTIVLPSPPEELRARLSLSVPLRSRVWLGGKEVDANASPVVLESPPLRADQSYTFDVKVTFPDGNKTEERTRSVVVGAGDEKSLTYQK